MANEIPEIDDCCAKEPYAFFGLAAYWAQVVEHSALNLAVVLRLPNLAVLSREEFEEIFEHFGEKTFGYLLNRSKKMLELSDSDEAMLKEALELRNFLIHRYFREHAEDFISEVGRHYMKQELRQAVAKLREADELLEKLYLPLWEKYGVSDEFVAQQMSEMETNALRRDGYA